MNLLSQCAQIGIGYIGSYLMKTPCHYVIDKVVGKGDGSKGLSGVLAVAEHIAAPVLLQAVINNSPLAHTFIVTGVKIDGLFLAVGAATKYGMESIGENVEKGLPWNMSDFGKKPPSRLQVNMAKNVFFGVVTGCIGSQLVNISGAGTILTAATVYMCFNGRAIKKFLFR